MRIEAFKYLPSERKQYKDDLEYRAALGFNREMFHKVEDQKMAPSDAYEKWKSDSREYQRAVLTLICASFAGP